MLGSSPILLRYIIYLSQLNDLKSICIYIATISGAPPNEQIELKEPSNAVNADLIRGRQTWVHRDFATVPRQQCGTALAFNPGREQPELGQPVFERGAAETQLAGCGGHVAIGGLHGPGVQPPLDLGKWQAEAQYIFKRIGAVAIAVDRRRGRLLRRLGRVEAPLGETELAAANVLAPPKHMHGIDKIAILREHDTPLDQVLHLPDIAGIVVFQQRFGSAAGSCRR